MVNIGCPTVNIGEAIRRTRWYCREKSATAVTPYIGREGSLKPANARMVEGTNRLIRAIPDRPMLDGSGLTDRAAKRIVSTDVKTNVRVATEGSIEARRTRPADASAVMQAERKRRGFTKRSFVSGVEGEKRKIHLLTLTIEIVVRGKVADETRETSESNFAIDEHELWPHRRIGSGGSNMKAT